MREPDWLDPTGSFLVGSCPLPLDQPFTVDQAGDRGVPRQVLRGLVASGHVRRVLRGVYAAAQLRDDIGTRTRAISLVVPPGAVVTDRTAAWLHGVDILPRSAVTEPPPLSVFRSGGTRVRREGVAGGTRGLLARDVMDIGGVQVTVPLRTACDLGRLLWRFDAFAAIDGFLRAGLPSEALIAELPRYRGYRGVRQLRFLAPLGDARAESPGESALRLHWYDAGLPRPELQHWVRDDYGRQTFRLDIALPDIRYAAEYDGEEFHSSDEDTEHDETRRDWIESHHHWQIEVFTKKDVYAPGSDPIPRLSQGAVRARRGFAVWSATRRTA
jgi:hypothetical protein